MVRPAANGGLGSEFVLPDRAKEIDFQFDCSEGFLGARVLANAIPIAASAITKNSAVQRSMGFACCGPAANMTWAPISDLLCLKSNQTRDGTSLTLARSLNRISTEFLEHS